jgi:hypothetical protein
MACNDPEPMLQFQGGPFSDRKLRLFACSCVRRVWDLITDRRSQRAIEIVELYADGLVSKEDLRSAAKAADRVVAARWPGLKLGYSARPHTKKQAAQAASYRAAEAAAEAAQLTLHIEHAVFLVKCSKSYLARGRADELGLEDKSQADLLREIFGNPFRPLLPRPEAIAPLAKQIYAGGLDQMPLLGKWLQEHGYWSEGEHCLDPKVQHVKGCWVVDWVTGGNSHQSLKPGPCE